MESLLGRKALRHKGRDGSRRVGGSPSIAERPDAQPEGEGDDAEGGVDDGRGHAEARRSTNRSNSAGSIRTQRGVIRMAESWPVAM